MKIYHFIIQVSSGRFESNSVHGAQGAMEAVGKENEELKVRLVT
jgi:hypothetical protein